MAPEPCLEFVLEFIGVSSVYVCVPGNKHPAIMAAEARARAMRDEIHKAMYQATETHHRYVRCSTGYPWMCVHLGVGSRLMDTHPSCSDALEAVSNMPISTC